MNADCILKATASVALFLFTPISLAQSFEEVGCSVETEGIKLTLSGAGLYKELSITTFNGNKIQIYNESSNQSVFLDSYQFPVEIEGVVSGETLVIDSSCNKKISRTLLSPRD